MEQWAINVVVLIVSFIGFGLTYWLSMILLPKVSNTFGTLEITVQCEFASRVHSSLHGVVVPLGVFICLTDCELWPTDANGGAEHVFQRNDCEQILGVFSVVIGYFLFDLGICLYYRYEMWQVFVVHHIVGMAPYIVTCFICENLPLLLGGGILVELANPGMNLEWWLEISNRTDSTLYRVTKHVSFLMWVAWRVGFPSYLIYGLFAFVIPHYEGGSCYITSYMTGILIFVFCWGVFLGMIVPGLLRHHGCIQADTEQLVEPSEEPEHHDWTLRFSDAIAALAMNRPGAMNSPTAQARMAQTVSNVQSLRRAVSTILRRKDGTDLGMRASADDIRQTAPGPNTKGVGLASDPRRRSV